MKKQKNGRVYWVTGMPGSGKTTFAKALKERLLLKKLAPILLDGDELRQVWGDFSYSQKDREKAALRNAKLAKLLASQNHTVIVATVSLFHQIQAWNRSNIPNYFEIYMKVDMQDLIKRDQKKLYSQSEEKNLDNTYGYQIKAQFPLQADHICENHCWENFLQSLDEIESLITEEGKHDPVR